MWLIVIFDLPVITPSQRKQANGFRLDLLDLGFSKWQLSVYAKLCSSKPYLNTLISKIKQCLPPQGDVELIMITDSQYERIITFQKRINVGKKKNPQQLELF